MLIQMEEGPTTNHPWGTWASLRLTQECPGVSTATPRSQGGCESKVSAEGLLSHARVDLQIPQMLQQTTSDCGEIY